MYLDSNALAFVPQLLIGYRQKFETVYPAKHFRKQFGLISYVTFRWMSCCIMRLATLQFETKLQTCIRMGITIFKIFIWGGISSDKRSAITFLLLRSCVAVPSNYICDSISDNYIPK